MPEMPNARSLKEKQRQEREQLILQVTEEVLLEKGYHEMSMDEIAARVGIAKGTLYLHFARKEDLVFALIDRELQVFQQTVEEAIAMDGTVQSRLAFIQRSMYLGLFGKRAHLLYALFNTADLRLVLGERHGAARKQIASRIEMLLNEGKERGELDPTVPTEVMQSTFMCMLSPLAYKHLVFSGKMTSEELVHYIERIYFRGIAAQAAPMGE